MLHGSLVKKMLLFTLPIALSSIIQQLFNAADTSIVGYFDNADALAAVGTNTEIVAFIVTLSSGLTIGANVLIANRIGKRQTQDIPAVVGTSVILALIVGAAGLICGQAVAAPLLRMIKTPQGIFPQAQAYLRIYLIGYPFLLLYDFGAAALRARGDSRYPFVALVISGVANVLLNLLFVIVFHLGVAGVAIATDISNVLSAAMVLYRLHKDDMFRLTFKNVRLVGEYTGEILKIGVPSAIQGAVFCFANIFVQASVNIFGANVIAGSTIAVNFEYFTYYIITAFAQTVTTFVGQNYAAGQIKRCKKIFWLCLAFSLAFGFVSVLPVVVFRGFFAGLFSTEAAVIENAGIRIMQILILEWICGIYEIPAAVLRGTGRAVLPAASTVVGTCVFRIVWICTVFKARRSLHMLYLVFPLSWLFTALLVWICYIAVRPLAARENGETPIK